MARKKCAKNHVRFDFRDDRSLANQKIEKTIAFEGVSMEPIIEVQPPHKLEQSLIIWFSDTPHVFNEL